MITLICLIFVIIFAITMYSKYRHSYWKRRGIPQATPIFFFGNAQDMCLGKKSIIDYQCDLYKALRPTKLLGVYMFYKPTLYIGDVNWIHNILHRDFRYFVDRGLKLDAENEPLTKHVFHLEGQQWKATRNKVMPTFTADGMKDIFFPMLLQSVSKLKVHLDGIIKEDIVDLDLKDILSRFAADVIGICAYGVDSGALTGKSATFYEMSMRTCAPRARTLLKLILPGLPNFICNLFDIKMVESRLSEYFSKVVEDELKKRRTLQWTSLPNDFPEFMMNLQHNNDVNSSGIQVTDDFIMAHCFMFFLAGFENATGNLCAVLFELADHPEIQNKLFEEIQWYCATNSDTLDITYEKLVEMKYLDMVVCETLRLYPPATSLVRECAQDYKIPGTDFVIEKGIQVVMPVCGIHRDARHFPYATEFNPENFAEEIVAKRSKSAYLPFGDGPRVCLGKRFGTIQIKLALVALVHNYVFYPSSKMRRPIEFRKKVFITSIEGGTWVRAESRSKKKDNIRKSNSENITARM